MPNWCEGNIRVRGTYDRIVSFFKENVRALKYDETFTLKDIPAEFVKEDDYYAVIRKPYEKCEDEFWIKGSRRQFIESKEIGLADYGDNDFDEITICIDGFKGAWDIDTECFGPMARKYGIDIKIFGFERGMQFAEWAEFKRDGSVNEKTIRYNDWAWDCPFPNLGG